MGRPPGPALQTREVRQPQRWDFRVSRGSPWPGCARSMCGSQVVVVRAVWLIRAGIPHLVRDLVEILTHLVAAQLLAHGLGPSSHALRIVFVDIREVVLSLSCSSRLSSERT